MLMVCMKTCFDIEVKGNLEMVYLHVQEPDSDLPVIKTSFILIRISVYVVFETSEF